MVILLDQFFEPGQIASQAEGISFADYTVTDVVDAAAEVIQVIR